MSIEDDSEPTTLARRPVEHDDEATSFDARPWGAQQRLLPDQRFSRTSGPLKDSSVAAIPSLPKAPVAKARPSRGPRRPASIARSLAREPSQRIEFAPPPARQALPPRPPTAPLYAAPVGHAAGAIISPAQAFVDAARASVDAARASASAFASYVDATLRVRRPALTKRSLIAAPLGALLAAIVIALWTLGSASSPQVASSLVHARIDHAAPAVVMTPAPVAAPPVAILEQREQVAELPVAAPVAQPVAVAAPVAKPARVHKSKRLHRPRKIVAGDTSTPLGDLRVRRF